MEKFTLFVFLVLFISQTLSDDKQLTNSETINSFDPLFKKLHNEITEIQTESHEQVYNIRSDFLNKLNEKYLTWLHNRGEAATKIDKKTSETLTQLNINNNNNSQQEKIKECFRNKNESTEQMIYEATGGMKVCRIYVTNKADEQDKILEELYAKQYQEHLDLEKVKNICNETSKSQEELKNCLANQLITVNVSNIQELKVESNKVLTNYDKVLGKLKDYYEVCTEIVENSMEKSADNVVFLFDQCCRIKLGISN